MNISKRRVSLLVLVLILTLTTVVSPVYGEKSEDFIQKEKNLLLFLKTLDYIKSDYPFEVEDEELIINGIKGVLQGLDEYSDYYTKEEAEQFMKKVSGDYAGIGVYIGERDGRIQITNIIEGTPGEKAGFKREDIIISVDDKETKDLTLAEVSQLLQGPAGTVVKVGILREGSNKPIYKEVTRENIKINPIKYETLEDNIGYIRIVEFNHYADRYTKAALKEFDEKGVDKVIVDLRYNPGGYLDQAVAVSRLFIPKGAIVHVRKKGNTGLTYLSNLEKPKYKLAVLVNGQSASASEIFAGAVKDRKAGTLVGTKTFGKGLIQGITTLSDGSLIKMTVGEYLTPNEISINNKGIEPDIVVENTEDKDLQLKKAIEILKK